MTLRMFHCWGTQALTEYQDTSESVTFERCLVLLRVTEAVRVGDRACISVDPPSRLVVNTRPPTSCASRASMLPGDADAGGTHDGDG
jgi:hypothetical protein